MVPHSGGDPTEHARSMRTEAPWTGNKRFERKKATLRISSVGQVGTNSQQLNKMWELSPTVVEWTRRVLGQK